MFRGRRVGERRGATSAPLDLQAHDVKKVARKLDGRQDGGDAHLPLEKAQEARTPGRRKPPPAPSRTRNVALRTETSLSPLRELAPCVALCLTRRAHGRPSRERHRRTWFGLVATRRREIGRVAEGSATSEHAPYGGTEPGEVKATTHPHGETNSRKPLSHFTLPAGSIRPR